MDTPTSDTALTTADIAQSTGLSRRHWARLAASGRVPGARQVAEGGKWVFDARQFAKWWNSRQREVVEWHPSTGGAEHGGRAPSVTAEKSAEALKQKIRELPIVG